MRKIYLDVVKKCLTRFRAGPILNRNLSRILSRCTLNKHVNVLRAGSGGVVIIVLSSSASERLFRRSSLSLPMSRVRWKTASSRSVLRRRPNPALPRPRSSRLCRTAASMFWAHSNKASLNLGVSMKPAPQSSSSRRCHAFVSIFSFRRYCS